MSMVVTVVVRVHVTSALNLGVIEDAIIHSIAISSFHHNVMEIQGHAKYLDDWEDDLVDRGVERERERKGIVVYEHVPLIHPT